MDMGAFLGDQSPLKEKIKGFSPREGQIQMAEAVTDCLSKEIPLLVEAGTGTGKTLAYLTPAVALGLKVVVSTGTKNLQDQVNNKELPLLRNCVKPDLRWAVLKGRANYLCLRRYEALAAQPELALAGGDKGLEMLETWVKETRTGDLDQVRGKGLTSQLISEITSNSEQCLGGRCPRRESCFLMEARKKAAEADIVVVNHHLFLADLKLKSEGHGEALPRYQAVVFDEAHLMADVATQVFGVSVSRRRLSVLLRDLGKEAGQSAAVMQAGAACEKAGAGLFAKLLSLAAPAGTMALTSKHLEKLAPQGEKLSQALEGLITTLGGNEEQEALAERAKSIVHDLKAVAQPVAGFTVAWAQARGKGVALNLSPVEVGPHLEAALYQEYGALVFTSATLAPAGDLEPARARLGLPYESKKLVVASPFDPAHQSLLYVPKTMPPPQARNFVQEVAKEVESLLELSGGRAFVLFTSYRNLEAVSRLLIPELPYHCLVQGQAPRTSLLEKFVKKSPSVLFATSSFWQGVDVPGEELSAVIVDKLPFSPPDDPLVAARMEKLEQDGKSGFAHLMVPEAILTLRQGLGRLLRTAEDRGLLAVLDVRLFTKGYGRRFLKALEPIPHTRKIEDVKAFFNQEKTAG